MTRREEIPVSGDMPTPPARRIDAQEKARQLLAPPTQPAAGQGESAADDAFKKITTRIPAEDVQWLKDEVKRYRQRNPRAAIDDRGADPGRYRPCEEGKRPRQLSGKIPVLTW